MAMNRPISSGGASRRALLLGLASLAVAGPARAALPPGDQELVRRVEGYFEGIQSLESRFSQIAPNGRLQTGTILLRRPGRLMLRYDPPSRVVMVASDWRLVFMDGSIQQMNVLPISETPLAFLLAEKVSLDGELDVTAVKRQGGEIALTVVRRKEPDQGHLVLYLAENPFDLRRWAVTDAQGLTTTVVLENGKVNAPIETDRLMFRDPTIFGWPK